MPKYIAVVGINNDYFINCKIYEKCGDGLHCKIDRNMENIDQVCEKISRFYPQNQEDIAMANSI